MMILRVKAVTANQVMLLALLTGAAMAVPSVVMADKVILKLRKLWRTKRQDSKHKTS